MNSQCSLTLVLVAMLAATASAAGKKPVKIVAFIKDIRKHLDVPEMPIVIAVAGHGGNENVHPASQQIRDAQTAAADLREFKGNVTAVQTAPFYDPVPHGDGGYHYNGSASFFYLAGEAFGKAMLEMLETSRPKVKTARNQE